jgi:uncharacterized protein YndB with AHSA1/START domain
VGFTATVELDQPRELVFDYLADPRNRPEWQASLLSVTLADRGDRAAEPHLGMRWRDNTLAGVRPRLEISRYEPPRVWAETGRWHGIRAELTMLLDTTPTGCRVRARGSLSGGGPWALPVTVAGRLAGPAIGHDLRRVGDVLTRRPR